MNDVTRFRNMGLWLVVFAGVLGFCGSFVLILVLALPPLLTGQTNVQL